MSNEGVRQVARQFPGHCHRVPSGCRHVIEFFSDLVSNAIAIGQVKEIARHGLSQRRCRTHVPKSASWPRKRPDPPGCEAQSGPGTRHNASPSSLRAMTETTQAKNAGFMMVKLQSPSPNFI
jgi:hypothetical protein